MKKLLCMMLFLFMVATPAYAQDLTFNSNAVVGDTVYYCFYDGNRAAFDYALGQWEAGGKIAFVEDCNDPSLIVNTDYAGGEWAGNYSNKWQTLTLYLDWPYRYYDTCVYTHELGHSIGLEHDDYNSVMATWLYDNPCYITDYDWWKYYNLI